MTLSLMKKLSAAFLFTIIMSLILTSIISNFYINKSFEEYLVSEQDRKVTNLVNLVENIYTSEDKFSNLDIDEIQRYAEAENFYIEIKDKNNNTLYNSGTSYLQHKGMMQNMMGSMMKGFSKNLGEYIEKDYALTNNSFDIGTITIGYLGTSYISYSSITFIKTLNRSFIISSIIALIFGVFVSIVISRQLSKPIINVTQTANQMKNGNLKVRSSIKTNTLEMIELSNSINYLAETLNNQEMLRKRMTSDISHELRTPLTTLKTHLEAFLDGVWEPTKDRLELFYEEINRLSGLVDNLRNLSKLEESNFTLNKEKINLSNEIKKIIDTFTPLYIKGNFKLVSSITPDVYAFIDRDKFKQIINNLLSNSYRYLNPHGNVQVILKKEKKNAVIEVIDNGMGISEKDLPHIFERFYRTDESRDKNTGGSGIGLTITKNLVEAHNGSISVQSKVNDGTKFTIEIPL